MMGNARQKAILEENDSEFEVKSILDEVWSKKSLRSFSGDRTVPEWFNRKAPAVKQGKVDPRLFDAKRHLKQRGKTDFGPHSAL
jgi:hypothetical protein